MRNRTAETPIKRLVELSGTFLQGVQALARNPPGFAQVPDIERGIDFYEEVARFEIDLIKLALLKSGGNQARAARLLGLKATTLNTKIKIYKIPKR